MAVYLQSAELFSILAMRISLLRSEVGFVSCRLRRGANQRTLEFRVRTPRNLTEQSRNSGSGITLIDRALTVVG